MFVLEEDQEVVLHRIIACVLLVNLVNVANLIISVLEMNQMTNEFVVITDCVLEMILVSAIVDIMDIVVVMINHL